MSGLFVYQPPSHFMFGQTWSETLQILLDNFSSRELLSPFTRSCFLLLLLGKALFACSPFPPCDPLSFTVELTLSSSCTRFDPSLSRQGVALGSLPSNNLVIGTDGSVPFAIGKGGSGVLANCSLCRAVASFSAGPVCSSFAVEACDILRALGWS